MASRRQPSAWRQPQPEPVPAALKDSKRIPIDKVREMQLWPWGRALESAPEESERGFLVWGRLRDLRGSSRSVIGFKCIIMDGQHDAIILAGVEVWDMAMRQN